VRARIKLRRRGWLLAPVASAAAARLRAAAIGGQAVHAADPPVGESGTDTSLPLTDSAVTIKGRDRFAGMEFTVNQTANLANQAISITWTGGEPTFVYGGAPARNYVQIMQCWGDDDGTNPANPGPPPEQCQQGAQLQVRPAGLVDGYAGTRIISRTDYDGYDPTVGYTDPATSYVWRPFRSVTGTVVDASADLDYNPQRAGNFWLNPFFNTITTNEIYSSRTDNRGQGQELFEVQTGVEASGLGCGKRVQQLADGQTKTPQCWLVIVPRGMPADENVGVTVDTSAVVTSPLAPGPWANRIAIPLDFNPLDSSCAIGQAERRIAGSELGLAAAASWQSELCDTPGGSPYSYSRMTDGLARQQIVNPSASAPGMVVVSRPVPPDRVKPSNPVVYAPLTLGGLVIGFNIERQIASDAPPEELALATARVASLNLTPRLVAKLLTQSYSSQMPSNQVPSDAKYDWVRKNPADIVKDPEFLRFNPEFTLLEYGSTKYLGGLALPLGNSDAAHQVWQWVLSDPEASEWMAGAADPDGMVVNPAYHTTPDPNRPELFPFGDPIPESFPKSEPACYQRTQPTTLTNLIPPPLCGADWFPYVDNLAAAAKAARPATLGAKSEVAEDAQSADKVWKREALPAPGTKTLLVLTDTASAARFGVQIAKLSRAGDNGPDRTFVAPDPAGLTAGVAAMEPSADDSRVLEPVPGKVAPGAYPLTALTYAAIAPLGLDADARDDYATFVEYASGAGQVSGFAPGDLPPGYVPLPASLVARTAETARLVREMVAPPEPPPTTVPETTTTTQPTTTPAPTTTTTEPTTTTTTRPRSGSGTTTTTRAPSTTTTVVAAETVAPETSTTVAATTPPPPPAEPEEPESPGITPATPIMALGRNRLAVPGLGVVALGSGLGALEITKRPRKGLPAKPPTPPPSGGSE
jgi:hypothetical protein